MLEYICPLIVEAEPDGRPDYQDVGRHDLLRDFWPIVFLPAVFRHIGPDALVYPQMDFSVEKTIIENEGHIKNKYDGGITRRDWLAGLAMQGMCAGRWQVDVDDFGRNELVDEVYLIADAMIAESNK